MKRTGIGLSVLMALASIACASHAPADGAGSVSSAEQGGTPGSDQANDDRPDHVPLATSFVFFGGCRMAKPDWVPATNPSSANVAELQQTLKDISNLQDKPRFLFFTGDLIYGLTKGTALLTSKLNAWATLFKSDPSGVASALDFVPMAGNHEVLYKVTNPDGSSDEFTNPGADAVWSSWISANGWDKFAGNGPTAADADDSLVNDQSRMSYSYDVDGTHYVILNTDTTNSVHNEETGSTNIGWVPATWLQQDLDAAECDPHVKRVLIFGHKPLISPVGKFDQDDEINPDLTDALVSSIDSHRKVKGYFCSHVHEWMPQQLPGTRGVWQIVAGNGGTPIETTWGQPYYGFTQARIYRNGAIGVQSYGRPVPKPYYSFATQPAQPVGDELMIYQPGDD